MAVTYKYGTEAQILALTPDSVNWVERGFYYCEDKPYFYQALNGVMKRYGGGENSSIGITLNSLFLSGVVSFVQAPDILNIPENYEYNVFKLKVEGLVNCQGVINIG